MKSINIVALSLLLASPIGIANADPWKDESGHGRYSRHWGRDHKVEYDDGHCKVERKWGKHGEYKEERKCRGGPPGFYGRGGPPGYGSSYPPGWYDPSPYRGYR